MKRLSNNYNLIQLDELSQADIKHDRCPECSNNELTREDGFKICPSCATVYKMLNGEGYIVPRIDNFNQKKKEEVESMNRISKRLKKMADNKITTTKELLTNNKLKDYYGEELFIDVFDDDGTSDKMLQQKILEQVINTAEKHPAEPDIGYMNDYLADWDEDYSDIILEVLENYTLPNLLNVFEEEVGVNINLSDDEMYKLANYVYKNYNCEKYVYDRIERWNIIEKAHDYF
jgi:uncharacterized Zn finger protein (UPF0148 family)